MQKELKDIRFITLPESRTFGEVTVDSSIPLPIQFPEGSVVDDIDFNSIVAGLIKVVAWDPENANIGYYKNLLLEMQPDVVKELNLAAIAKSDKKEYGFAEELMLAVRNLSDAPESYVNLAVLYAKMTVDLHKEGKDTQADLYDDKILQVLNECKEKHEDYAATYSEISAFHMRHGDIESARDNLARYIELEKNDKKQKTLTVSIDKVGKMFLGEEPVTQDVLRDRLAKAGVEFPNAVLPEAFELEVDFVPCLEWTNAADRAVQELSGRHMMIWDSMSVNYPPSGRNKGLQVLFIYNKSAESWTAHLYAGFGDCTRKAVGPSFKPQKGVPARLSVRFDAAGGVFWDLNGEKTEAFLGRNGAIVPDPIYRPVVGDRIGSFQNPFDGYIRRLSIRPAAL